MISHLKLKNFKAWAGESVDCQLAPITLFLGTNSTGKSSLIQSLLVLKQTALSPDRSIHLNLGGAENDFVDLGEFDDVLNKSTSEKRFSIGLTIDPKNITHSQHRIGFTNQYDIKFSAEYGRNYNDVPYVYQLEFIQNNFSMIAKRHAKATYSVSTSSEKLERKQEHAPERSIFLPRATTRALIQNGHQIEDISLHLNSFFESLSYLGPLRSKPKREYTWNKSTPAAIGNSGEHAIPALLANLFNKPKKINLVKKLSYWLKRMGVADSLEVKRVGSTKSYRILIEKDGISANLLDVGFGISQVLPVLILAYFAKSGSTVILEEPEIHLHPLAQSVLAELFVKVSKERNVQFIIETHSEPLFRRLQTLIAQEKLTHNDYALYFIEREEQAAKLTQLKADPFGRISNWPKNFFGDSMGEIQKQSEAMSKQLIAKS